MNALKNKTKYTLYELDKNEEVQKKYNIIKLYNINNIYFII